MSIFGGINYNKTFISTITMLFIFTITLGLLFFVFALSHQTFAQEGGGERYDPEVAYKIGKGIKLDIGEIAAMCFVMRDTGYIDNKINCLDWPIDENINHEKIIEAFVLRHNTDSTLKNITNNNEIIGQTQGSKSTTNNNTTDLLFEKYYPIVKVDYESDSMVVLEANENYLSEINGSLVPFWESMDVVKNQGYSLNEITTLGTGSIENPIIFYAIFFNNSNNKLEK